MSQGFAIPGYPTSLVLTALQITGLTASLPIVTDAGKNLVSISYASFKTNLVLTKEDIAGLLLASSPQFTGLNLSGLTVSKVIVTDASKNLTSGTNTDAEIASAVSLKHTQGTDTALGAIAALTASLPVVTDISKNLVSLAYATFKTNLALTKEDIAGLLLASSPQFTGLNLSGLSASVPVVSDGSKALVSQTYANFKTSLAIAQADVSGLTTASSPTFAGLTVGALAGIIKAAAGVLSATALGAANLKFFMNAAGTAPEWASGLKIISTTYDTATASGNQSITGAGFKPGLVMVLGAVTATAQVFISFKDASYHGCLWNDHNRVANTWGINPSFDCELVESSTVYSRGTISSLDADGITISWNKNGAKTGIADLILLFLR